MTDGLTGLWALTEDSWDEAYHWSDVEGGFLNATVGEVAQAIVGEVTQIIQQLARVRRRIAEVRPRDNLLALGIVDSLAIVKLILSLEERFPIRITDEDIVPENFRDIESLSRFVQSKLR